MRYRVYITVPTSEAQKALEVLRESGHRAFPGDDALALDRSVIVLVKESQLSVSAAFAEGSTEVMATLRHADIAASHLATDVVPGDDSSNGTWAVRRPLQHLGFFPAVLMRVLLAPAGPWRRQRRRVVWSLGRVELRIRAADLPTAVDIARRLRPNWPKYRLRSLNQPSLAGRANATEDFDFVTFPLIILTAFVTGAYAGTNAELAPNIVGSMGIIFAVVAVLYGDWSSAMLRLFRLIVYVSVGCLAAQYFRHFFPDPARTTWQIIVAVLLVVGGVGVGVEWRSRRAGRSLPWLLPVALSITGAGVVALGLLSYRQFEATLGLPYGSLEPDTIESVVAGLPASVAVLVAVYGIVGFYGLMRWTLGSPAVSTVMIGLGTAMAVLTAVLAAIQLGDAGARSLSVAVSRGPAESLPVYGITKPLYVCLERVDDAPAVEGGKIVEDDKPWLYFDLSDGRYLIWRLDEGYRRIASDAYTVTPSGTSSTCS